MSESTCLRRRAHVSLVKDTDIFLSWANYAIIFPISIFPIRLDFFGAFDSFSSDSLSSSSFLLSSSSGWKKLHIPSLLGELLMTVLT